jgi:heavy metal sensor kinase
MILVVLGITLRYSLEVVLTQGVERDMLRNAERTQKHVEALPSLDQAIPWFIRPHVDHDPFALPNTDPLSGKLWPRILDLNGKPALAPLPGSSGLPDGILYGAGFALARRGQTDFKTVIMQGIAVRIGSFPLSKNGRIIAVLQVGHEMTDVEREVNALTRVLLTLIPLGILAAALGGAFLTRRAMLPVRQMTSAAATIGAKNLSERLDVAGNDEFATLAETFNGMLDRLENAFRRLEQMYEQQRQFTGDASHELRTPLTIIKANASLALSASRTKEEYFNALKAIDHAADRTNRILQDLLMLARADAGQLEIPKDTVSVAAILDDACATYKVDGGARLISEPADPALWVRGNASMLTRVIENLLSNAVRHTPATGSIRVYARSAGNRVDLVVSDTGEGISPDHLPHLTKRFYRADPARSRAQGGTGLGLAICLSIVDLHHGDMAFESTIGAGTTVTVSLPLVVASAATSEDAGAAKSTSRASSEQAEAA